MRNIFFFDTMLTPKIIVFVYWLMLFGSIVSGLGIWFSAGHFLLGIMAVIFGAVGARIWCELLIVLFKMNEALQDIRKK